jgi:hypothetical protein
VIEALLRRRLQPFFLSDRARSLLTDRRSLRAGAHRRTMISFLD